MSDKVYDVVIVGAGVVGSVLAKWLTREGKDVVLLEAGTGDALNHEGYQSSVRHFYTVPNRPNSPYVQNDKAGMPGIPWPADQEKNPDAWLSDKQYWIQEGPIPFGSDYTRAAGGTTLHWLGVSMRHVPNDFHTNEKYGRGRDWPVTYKEMMPYYRRAEYELGVAADVKEQSYLGVEFEEGYVYPMVSFPMTYLDTVLQQDIQGMTFEEDGIDYSIEIIPTPQARNATPNPQARILSMTSPGGPLNWKASNPEELESDRPYQPVGNPTLRGVGLGERCEGNSSCIPICPVQAKYNATKSLAQADQQRLDLRLQCVASKILLDDSGKHVTGIEYKHYKDPNKSNYTTETVHGKIYVVAAHTVETAKLCLMSDVANSSGLMGCNLMDHPYLNYSGLYPKKIWGYRGPDVTGGMPLLRDGGFRKKHASFRTDIGNWGWEFPKGAPGSIVEDMVENQGLFGKELREALEDQGPRHMRIGFLMEQLPDKNNRVVLEDKDGNQHLDDLGIPRPIIHYNVDDYTLAGMEAAHRFATALFDKAGIEMQVQTPSPEQREYNQKSYYFWGSGHLIGTHVMGKEKEDSVVDPCQQTHDHENLFLAGCGSHPGSATANPTLTMAALTFKTLDRILEKLED